MAKRILTVFAVLISSMFVGTSAHASIPAGFGPVHTARSFKVAKPRKHHHRRTHRASRSYIRPVPTVAPAPAPVYHNWDAVAQCESGGNWGIDTGNGFYGGLQFSLGTWYGFGGQGMPQYASRASQITIAERILAVQGIGAWPICGAYL